MVSVVARGMLHCVPVIVFGIYLTKHPQHGDRFQIQIRNTGRGDDPLKVFGIYLERRRNSGVWFSRYKFEHLFVEEFYFDMLMSLEFERNIRYIL